MEMTSHAPASSVDRGHIATVRRFNRFHTRLVGALNEVHLATPYPLAQVRVLYELAQVDSVAAADLARMLAMDAGQLSRLVTTLEAQGLIARTRSSTDGRRINLSLTEKGAATSAELIAASSQDVADLLVPLSVDDRRSVVAAMGRIMRLLGDRSEPSAFILRDPEPGDLGWIIHRQGALYAREHGFDVTFEALVAEIVADFAKTNDPSCERCWVADRDGEIVGSVFIVRKDAETAKLRLLYVDPSARGLGLGRRLVDECLRFAGAKGYRRMTLWTNANLHAARNLYERAGFRMTGSEPHQSWGQDLIGETWERDI